MVLMEQKEQGFCEIEVKGRLDPRWVEWFELMNVVYEADVTVISGVVIDQPALQGLMEKISMLGMTIVSIKFTTSENGEDARSSV